MELNDVLGSKTYVREEGAVSYCAPVEYLKPFIDIVDANVISWSVKVSEPVSNENPEDHTLNIAYPRVLVESRFGIDPNLPGFESVIGLIYALNTRQPIMKVYSGENVSACTNLTIFNPEHVFQQDLLGNYRNVYSKAKEYFDNKKKEIEEFKVIYNQLQNTFLTEEQFHERMGGILVNAVKSRLGTSPVVQAANMMMDNSSQYAVRKGNDFICNEWNIFNAVTQALNSTDLVLLPTKTISLAKIFLRL